MTEDEGLGASEVRITRGERRALPLLLAAVTAVAALTGCNEIAPLDPGLRAAFITVDADDDFGIAVDGDVTTVTAAPTNTDANTRLVLWRSSTPRTADQRSCVSWTEEGTAADHAVQPGVALRIRSSAGRTQAIVVTKNVFHYGFWTYDVHLMDSAAEQPFVLIGRVNLIDVVLRSGVLAPSPWRLCAQVVGDALSMKLWPGDVDEPAWSDGVHGAGLVLPPGWDEPGAAGWYAGHVGPGQALELTDPTVTQLPEVEAAQAELVGSALGKRRGRSTADRHARPAAARGQGAQSSASGSTQPPMGAASRSAAAGPHVPPR